MFALTDLLTWCAVFGAALSLPAAYVVGEWTLRPLIDWHASHRTPDGDAPVSSCG